MTPLVFASLGFSWLWVASAGDPCSSMETEGQSGCVDGQGIGAALIQTKLHGLKQVVADEVHGSSKQTTLGHALQLVTQLVQKSGGHSWNMTADEKLAVETIRDMVQDLFNGSLIQHGEDQFEVDQARDRIQSCTDDTRNELNGAVTGKKNQANATRTEHAECRKRENNIIANTTRECDSYHSYRKSQSNFEPFNYATCMSSDLTFNHIKSDHEVTKQNMESCLVKTVEMLRPLYHEFLGCKESNELRKKVHLECDEDQEEFEADFCRYSRELDGACSTYSGCRSQAIGDRSRTHEAVKKAEVARKADWVTAEHILCLLQVFEQDNSDKAAQLKECTEATVNTTRINIEYHSIPEPDPCPGPWRTDKPCDDDWLETEYRSQSWFNSSTINQCIACQAPAPPTPAPSAPTQAPTPASTPTPTTTGWHAVVEQEVSQNTLSLAPNDNVPTLVNNDFVLTVQFTATDIDYPRSMCPLYFEHNPTSSSHTGFSIGHLASQSSIQVRMADGSDLASVDLNYAQPLSLNTRHSVELKCFRIPEGRRCTVSVDGAEGDSANLGVRGDIYSAGGPVVWGDVWGWNFIGTLHSVSLG